MVQKRFVIFSLLLSAGLLLFSCDPFQGLATKEISEVNQGEGDTAMGLEDSLTLNISWSSAVPLDYSNSSLIKDNNTSTYYGTSATPSNLSMLGASATITAIFTPAAGAMTVNSVQTYFHQYNTVYTLYYKISGTWVQKDTYAVSGTDVISRLYSTSTSAVEAIKITIASTGGQLAPTVSQLICALHEVIINGTVASAIPLFIQGDSFIKFVQDLTQTSPLRIKSPTGTKYVYLVDTTSSLASALRIKTTAGIKALAKYI